MKLRKSFHCSAPHFPWGATRDIEEGKENIPLICLVCDQLIQNLMAEESDLLSLTVVSIDWGQLNGSHLKCLVHHPWWTSQWAQELTHTGSEYSQRQCSDRLGRSVRMPSLHTVSVKQVLKASRDSKERKTSATIWWGRGGSKWINAHRLMALSSGCSVLTGEKRVQGKKENTTDGKDHYATMKVEATWKLTILNLNRDNNITLKYINK